jgi:hypothetical protein
MHQPDPALAPAADRCALMIAAHMLHVACLTRPNPLACTVNGHRFTVLPGLTPDGIAAILREHGATLVQAMELQP